MGFKQECVCLKDEPWTITVDGGEWPEEVSWTLSAGDEVIEGYAPFDLKACSTGNHSLSSLKQGAHSRRALKRQKQAARSQHKHALKRKKEAARSQLERLRQKNQ